MGESALFSYCTSWWGSRVSRGRSSWPGSDRPPPPTFRYWNVFALGEILVAQFHAVRMVDVLDYLVLSVLVPFVLEHLLDRHRLLRLTVDRLGIISLLGTLPRKYRCPPVALWCIAKLLGTCTLLSFEGWDGVPFSDWVFPNIIYYYFIYNTIYFFVLNFYINYHHLKCIYSFHTLKFW